MPLVVGEILTFARRKKGQSLRTEEGSPLATERNAQEKTVASAPAADDGNGSGQNDAASRWRRKAARTAKAKREVDQEAHFAEIRAHFHEVDSFDLAVETPTPPGKAVLYAEGRTLKQNTAVHLDALRPMSIGLSRRSSAAGMRHSATFVAAHAAPSPLLNLAARASTAQYNAARKSTAGADLTGEIGTETVGGMTEIGSEQPRRSSAATGALGRLSAGITDALRWLAKRGSLAGDIHQADNHDHAAGRISLLDVQSAENGIFPIVENDEAPTPESWDHQLPASSAKMDRLQAEFSSKLNLHATPLPTGRTPCQSTPLEQLLQLCGQKDHSDCLPSMEQLLGQHINLAQVRKIGEGTFGEAFKAGNVVLKIVPMEGQLKVNGEQQKRAEEILGEVAVTLTLSGLRGDGAGCDASIPSGAARASSANVTSGFVETYGVGVCRGRYAPLLCTEWHRWDSQHASDNDPVDVFDDEQLFVVFVVADGGLDLEHFGIRSFAELRSILIQVTMALAVAEEACEFEHRDLHWGNLLIRRDGCDRVAYRLRDVDVEVAAAGVQVTLIDFTLSRLLTPEGEVAFCDMAADPELFQGPKGDAQAETYRRMQKVTKADWRSYTAATNTLWLRYLADIMLAHKMPDGGYSSDERLQLRNFKKRAMGASSAGEIIWDDFFVGQWSVA